APSSKAAVVEALFDARWVAASGSLSNPVVTLEDVGAAIQAFNEKAPPGQRLSPRNLANFFRDFVRTRASANRNWPPTVLRRGYPARQVTGDNRCFEFVPLAAGQALPFPLTAVAGPAVPRRQLESVSLPLALRRLGRTDETWLLQVVVRLRVLETHLS